MEEARVASSSSGVVQVSSVSDRGGPQRTERPAGPAPDSCDPNPISACRMARAYLSRPESPRNRCSPRARLDLSFRGCTAVDRSSVEVLQVPSCAGDRGRTHGAARSLHEPHPHATLRGGKPAKTGHTPTAAAAKGEALRRRATSHADGTEETEKQTTPRKTRGCPRYIKQQLEAFVGCYQPTIPANGSEGVLTVSRSRSLWTRV